jgi:hypothetical protein
MTLQVSFVLPHFLIEEDLGLLYVVVKVTTETAGINLALLSHRFENFHCLGALLARDIHPNGCENHTLVSSPF